MKKSYEMDMCHGPILGKLLLFTLPLMLSGILQLLFNAADIIVVGKFAGSHALAAVGSTNALINLFVNVFIGFSISANVMVGQYFGAKDAKNVHETIHTAILLAAIGGVILIAVGFLFSRPILVWMDTPADVIDHSVLYIQIYFLGMPAMLVYNFGSAILRAIGDTRRPLYFLIISGVINVVLNLFFVIVLHLDVAGVAIATAISQTVAAILIVLCLMNSDGMYRLELRKLRIYRSKLIAIMRIGLPAGLQGSVFSISNVLIQSSINSFGSIAMAGSTAAGNIEGFIYTAMNAVYQTALSFVSQNVGGGQKQRIPRITVLCLVTVITIGLVMSNIALIFGEQLLGLYSSDPEVIQFGLDRLSVIAKLYFLCGVMEIFVGVLRGLGYALMPMIVSLIGACGLRIVWIFTVFQWSPTLFTLFLSYPVTWAITLSAHFICLMIVWKKEK